ncbi:MAG: amidohydrolase family protein [Clostridia bacterium]|nr:amidohydrolase family protein [Clostridia bacterium]
MKTVIKSDKIILKDKILNGYLALDGEGISYVGEEKVEGDVFYDYTGKYVSPGFIETHTHGAGGFPFIDCTEDDVINACNFELEYGVTSICPTVTSGPITIMEDAVDKISKAKKNPKTKPNIIGAHLEGPYFSLNQSGAQSPNDITAPIKEDYERIIKKFGKDIARWSYAPERDENAEFCKYLIKNGIVASAGHTDALGVDMELARENGCKLITHLYSCTSTITRDKGFRRLGVIETAYLNDDIYVEIITDGKHLPPDLLKLILKIKGTDKVILTTDSLKIAGTDAKGGGAMSGVEYIVEEGVCRLKDRSAFAGSIATADRLIRVITKEAGASIVDGVKMLTYNPAKIFNLNTGEIKVGKDGDIIVFDDDINVSDVFVKGNKVK